MYGGIFRFLVYKYGNITQQDKRSFMNVEYLVQRLSEEVFVQVWKYIAFPDDRICGYCKDLNGKKYSYHTSRKPKTPLHANCRCYYELQKIPYDGKKSATLTGFAWEARYIINEFIFDTDNNGRVISASGRLQSISGLRNARNQMRAAAWGRSGDEGGHLIPAKYGGPGHLLNTLPQARNVNRSVIKKIENEKAKSEPIEQSVDEDSQEKEDLKEKISEIILSERSILCID